MQLDERSVARIDAEEIGRAVHQIADGRGVRVRAIDDRVAGVELVRRGDLDRVVRIVDCGLRIENGGQRRVGIQRREQRDVDAGDVRQTRQLPLGLLIDGQAAE